MAKAMANVTFDTVVAGVQGLSAALTSVIMGSQSAGQAFAQFGTNLLTNFISTILSAVLYAKVALPILTALNVLTAGGPATGGALATTAAVTSTIGMVMSVAGGGLAGGGYTGDGPTFEPAGVVHRGEFVVPAWRTAEIGVPALQEMAFGESGGANSGGPIRAIIVDDQRNAERLMRDPRFQSFIIDLRQA
jgi:hypothetical protein